jgi:uncharacterized protein (TIGR02246 family)
MLVEPERAVFDSQIAGDLNGWLDCFADDAVLMAPNQPPLSGLQSIRDWAAPFFDDYDLHEETDNREVRIAGDWGYIRAHWTWTLTPNAGGEASVDSGNSIWIVRRQDDGSWKIARAIWNSERPDS